jgi:hypothetical protein
VSDLETPPNPYNYERFLGDDDFLAFRRALPIGSRAPDGRVIEVATGQERALSEFWHRSDVVIEFGSLT